MKKIIALACLLCLLTLAACAEGLVGQAVPDFTLSTTDGGSVTLSELLKAKDLVVLNIFATWCPPCAREFPEMQAVYEKLSDRMEIVAVSADPGDTMDAVADYKAERGLTFPMGLAGDALGFVPLEAYPTTLMIDRNGVVGYTQVGMFSSAGIFKDVCEVFLTDDYTFAAPELYAVGVGDQDYMALQGVEVTVTGEGRTYDLTTGSDGFASFIVPGAGDYQAVVTGAPEGYAFDPDAAQPLEDGTAIILLDKEG